MKVAVFDTHHFEKDALTKANELFHHELSFFEPRLTHQTAMVAHGFSCVCCFVNDELDAQTLCTLQCHGVKLVALRSAGYNNVDLQEAEKLGIRIVRVPAYSPHAVAEHAVGLLLALNRKIYRAYNRVRDLNFSLDGLVGFDLHEKTVGVIGTGKIGATFSRIMRGFGCNVLAYDVKREDRLERERIVEYVELPELLGRSDIVSLHVPLLPETKHLIDASALKKMKEGVYLINTGRGALIDSRALIESLKSGHVGAAGLDVSEEEEGIFFQDLSDQVLKDDVLARLLTFPNVVITSHQAFLTREALQNIAQATLKNISDFEAGNPLLNEIRVKTHLAKK